MQRDGPALIDDERARAAGAEGVGQVEERHELTAGAPEDHVRAPVRRRVGDQRGEGDRARVVHRRGGGVDLGERGGAAVDRDEVVVDGLHGAAGRGQDRERGDDRPTEHGAHPPAGARRLRDRGAN